ncbi:hypothetical protein ACKFKG_10890 [Phormidesmis sp. 146-35]
MSDNLRDFLSDDEPPTSYEKVRILIIGFPAGVTETIHTLYSLSFAEVNDWSPLLPAPRPGEVMSILRRDRHRRDEG